MFFGSAALSNPTTTLLTATGTTTPCICFPPPTGNDVAFTYKAPRDGVLKLSFGDASLAQDAAGNKIGLAVYKNNVQIWPEMGVYTVQSDEGGWAEKALGLEAVVSAVHAGDLLHIRASLIESVGEYALKVMPEAEYTSLEYDESLDKEAEFNKAAKYSYTDQFSGTQGQDCWWYLYAPIGENTVMQVPYYQDGAGMTAPGITSSPPYLRTQ